MSGQPVALPKDFETIWSKGKLDEVHESQASSDPFRDPSRITASGFTETTINPENWKQRKVSFEKGKGLSREDEDKYSNDVLNMVSKLTKLRARPASVQNDAKIMALEKDINALQSRTMRHYLDIRPIPDEDLKSNVETISPKKKGKEVEQPREFKMEDLIGELADLSDSSDFERKEFLMKEVLKIQAKQLNNLHARRVDKFHEGDRYTGNKSYATMKDFTDFTTQVSGTIKPSDSISNVFEPLSIRKLQPLTVVKEESDSKNVFAESTVIGGYNLSVEEKLEELDMSSSIKPVRGLPIIFTNTRLNFLTHLHDALFLILTDKDGRYPSEDCLSKLLGGRRRWGGGPTQELLEQVVDKTIDGKTGIVKANPFCLPIIEVSMGLTQELMYMCLDMLHTEFELEWFKTMKSVTTPKFQSKYEALRYKRHGHSRNDSTSSGNARRSSRSSGGKSASRRSSGSSEVSFLGTFFSGNNR